MSGLTVVVMVLIHLFVTNPAATQASGPSDAKLDLEERTQKPYPWSEPEGLAADKWAAMQDLMQATQYHFTWQSHAGEWAYRALNRAHGLSLASAPDGFTATRYSTEGVVLWDLGLSLLACGEQALSPILDADGLSGHHERVEYDWDENVTEWYENSSVGVKHGLTLRTPSPGSDVVLAFSLQGNLAPELDASRQVLRLRDQSGSIVLLYDHLLVTDAIDHRLPACMELDTQYNPHPVLRVIVDASSAVYPLAVDSLLHGEAAVLRSSEAQAGDEFGYSVDISGDTVIVGAPWEDGGPGDSLFNAGAAYIFERDQGGPDSWGEVTILRASDAQAEDYFGVSVAIDGDIVVVGAYSEDGGVGDPLHNTGAAYVFARNQGGENTWGEVIALHSSEAQAYDWFGSSVTISGDIIVIGAYREDGGPGDSILDAGAAYVFERNQGGADNWGEVTILRASDAQADDYFSEPVAIDGDTIVVAARWEDGGSGDPIDAAGAAYIYERNQGGVDNWGELAILRSSEAQANDLFASSISISGDTIVVGAYGEDGGPGDPASSAGAAYVFERNQGGFNNWGESAILRSSEAQANDVFGWSVSISGDTTVVGARFESGGSGNPLPSSGAAYVYKRNQGGVDSWGEVSILRASDAQAQDQFGYSVSVSEDTIVIGASVEDGGSGDPIDKAGAAYLFADHLCFMPLALRNYSPPCDPYEPNDDRHTNPWGPLQSAQPYQAKLCLGDIEDNYYFDVIATAPIHLHLQLPSALANHTSIWLYTQSNLSTPICGTGPVGADYSATCPITQVGRYVVRLYTDGVSDGVNAYTLQVTFE